MPHPNELKLYEEILPGFAERTLTMVESQQRHRHTQESKMVDTDVHGKKVGMYLAFVIAMLGLIMGAGLIALGKTWEGGLISGVPIGAILTTLGVTTISRRKDREAKAKILAGQ